MTAKNELLSEMAKFGDSGCDLAEYLGITPPTLSKKLNGKAEFTQAEIRLIKSRYNLTADRVDEIFFATEVSSQDTEVE